ncbi:hypothetical protein [Tropicimonas sp. IMCC34011]|uniref:hypothetical protein n=1 Tax=Tropicimonas sp. IMCC34011 TaxID=2248759 RepID=UPI0018E559EA|nr:hypothetical protein [Tropicimonas sp. IMCC34011]
MTPDHDLTRGDEDIDPRAFERREKDPREPSFGSWPELAGLVFAILLTWLIFAFVE